MKSSCSPILLKNSILHSAIASGYSFLAGQYCMLNQIKLKISCLYRMSRCLRMLAWTSETLTLVCHLINGFPTGPTRNFPTVHWMLLVCRSCQSSLSVGFPKSSPTGKQEFLRKVKTSCSSIQITFLKQWEVWNKSIAWSDLL